MISCGVPSKLPENIPSMPVEDAVETVLQAHFDDSQSLKECARKHKTLIQWINSE